MTTETEPIGLEYVVLAWGLVYASVCTELPIVEATARLNREHPTGISSPWAPSTDPTFTSGEPNPFPCPALPATHKHYLFSC